MSKRITIMLNDETDKKIRTYQAKRIQKTQSSYSFSAAVNELLESVI